MRASDAVPNAKYAGFVPFRMVGPGAGRDRKTVVCIACGSSLLRSDAREYDKLGDRWERRGKAFEHLCKACHGELCHQPRNDLESLLVDAGAGEVDKEAFLAAYVGAVRDSRGEER